MSTPKIQTIDEVKKALLHVVGNDLKEITLRPLTPASHFVDKKWTSPITPISLFVEYPNRRFEWLNYQNWTCCGEYRSFGGTYLGTKGTYSRGDGLTFVVCQRCAKYHFVLGNVDIDSMLTELRTWMKTL